ncbi:MAG: class II aldolase/adducin family protein [Polyangiales bacterium]
MTDEITKLLRADEARLTAKWLYGQAGDSLSMRIPGRDEFLLALPDGEELRRVSFQAEGKEAAGLHAAVYRSRKDAGAVLVGRTPWSAALASVGAPIPTLFDEQARHIGNAGKPVRIGRGSPISGAIEDGSNIAIFGDQRICVGTTPNRVVFNAELFEKCAKAFVVAQASGHRIRKVPGWVRYIAGGRLRKDQKRAAESYAAGRIPEGMDGY